MDRKSLEFVMKKVLNDQYWMNSSPKEPKSKKINLKAHWTGQKQKFQNCTSSQSTMWSTSWIEKLVTARHKNVRSKLHANKLQKNLFADMKTFTRKIQFITSVVCIWCDSYCVFLEHQSQPLPQIKFLNCVFTMWKMARYLHMNNGIQYWYFYSFFQISTFNQNLSFQISS